MDPYYSAAIDMNGNEVWNSGGLGEFMFLNIININNRNKFSANTTFPPNHIKFPKFI